MTIVAESDCRIEDLGPLPVARPQSVAELGNHVRQAAAAGQAIYPLGGRTGLDLGRAPTRTGIGIDLGDLAQLIDYPARDMTITVQAGIRVAQLQEALAAEKQRLPVDVPQAAQATLGGALATNTSGPRRYGCGTLRDYVIGISVMNDEGVETRAGGRVVKNVAGYDLCKLHIGALGTLGIITQVTLKLKPRPEEHALIVVGCENETLAPLLDQLHASRTRPVCLEVLNRAAAAGIEQQIGLGLPSSTWLLVVGFEDNSEAVNWQVQQLVRELPAASGRGLEARLGVAAEPLWDALGELPARAGATLIFKANLLPHAMAAFCQQALRLEPSLWLQAHAGNGIVLGQVEDALTLERAQTMLTTLRDLAVEAHGNLILLRCPTGWKETLPVWGAPRGDLWLMKQVKQQLDPRRLFNPDRFLDGI